jgi:hypothetical protein
MTAPGLPIIVASNGRGLPVTVSNYGVPIKTSTNGLGIPVVVKASGGLPVKYVDAVNLLDGLPWIQGSNTTMSISGGLVRATATLGNPRVYKFVSGLSDGATYKLNGTMYRRTMFGDIIFRITPNVDIPDGAIYSLSEPGASHTFVNQTFVMIGTSTYIGIVGVANNTGEYCEIDENFSLTAA